MVNLSVRKLLGLALLVVLIAGTMMLAITRIREDRSQQAVRRADALESGSCKERWSRYRDPDGLYSFCYPQDFRLRISHQEPYAVSAELRTDLKPASEANVIAFSIFWRSTRRYESGQARDRCFLEQQHFGVLTREEEMTIAGQTVVACRAVGKTATHGDSPMELELASRTDNGSLRVGVLFGSDSTHSAGLIDALLASLAIPAEP